MRPAPQPMHGMGMASSTLRFQGHNGMQDILVFQRQSQGYLKAQRVQEPIQLRGHIPNANQTLHAAELKGARLMRQDDGPVDRVLNESPH